MRGFLYGVTLVPCLALLALLPGAPAHAAGGAPEVRVSSKLFPESVILGEMLRMLAEDAGARAIHRARLGDTSASWAGLMTEQIDAYAEYTGTLTQEILVGERIRT
jgi:osmoprotectant transport system permease protein